MYLLFAKHNTSKTTGPTVDKGITELLYNPFIDESLRAHQIMRHFLFFLTLPLLSAAFSLHPARSVSSSALGMAPRYDKQLNRWEITSPEEGPEGGYDIWGTVIRHGPVPLFNRIAKADEYEQGVLKFMAGDKVDRMTAQAEMDAYLANPNDWAYNRLNGYNVDYLSINQKQLTLNLVWSALILTLLARGAYCSIAGEYYWSFIPGAHSKISSL